MKHALFSLLLLSGLAHAEDYLCQQKQLGNNDLLACLSKSQNALDKKISKLETPHHPSNTAFNEYVKQSCSDGSGDEMEHPIQVYRCTVLLSSQRLEALTKGIAK